MARQTKTFRSGNPQRPSPSPSDESVLFIFLNMPYTLCCPFAATLRFENCVSGSLFPTFMLSSALFGSLSDFHPKEERYYLPFNPNILYATPSYSSNLFLHLRSRQTSTSSCSCTSWRAKNNMGDLPSPQMKRHPCSILSQKMFELMVRN